MAKLSVIVPIYNVEKYLRKCLDSVVNQTLSDLEIILVDDGSPDRCGEICDEYAANDSRIKVIHKKNGGLPSARNAALDVATGEWVAFVDSDDWLELDIYEKAVMAGERKDVDILFFNSFRNNVTKETNISLFQNEFFSDDKKYIKSLQAGVICLYFTQTHELYYGFPWDRIIKREFIMQNNLYFTDCKAYEDMLYAINCLQFANKIAFIEDRGYHYRFNNTSIGNKYNPNRVAIDREVYQEMFRLAETYKADDNFYRALYAFIVDSLAMNVSRCFFHKKNQNTLKSKMQYVNTILGEEPYHSAFLKVDRRLLTRGGKFITLMGYPNAWSLYIYHILKTFKNIIIR
jgi:glycosyltransferase involved in cell wall biosynthesis